jgi:hypothetical protein
VPYGQPGEQITEDGEFKMGYKKEHKKGRGRWLEKICLPPATASKRAETRKMTEYHRLQKTRFPSHQPTRKILRKENPATAVGSEKIIVGYALN